MRLFYINYADLSVAYGATVCIVELARALVKQGHEVTVIVPQFRPNPHYASRFAQDGFDVATVPIRDIRFVRKIAFYWRSALWVIQLARIKRPDILYWGEMTYTLTPSLVSKLLRIPYAIIAHGFAPDELRVSRWRMAIVKWCQKVYFGNADAIITVTPKIAERIHEVYSVPKERLHPIENGVNLERFKPMDKGTARSLLGLPDGYTYIGWVGYFFPWSGVETLLQAAKCVVSEEPSARFIIVGHGLWGTHLTDFAKELGLRVLDGTKWGSRETETRGEKITAFPLPRVPVSPEHWDVWFTGEVPNELVPVFINAWDIATAPYPGGRNEKSGGSSMKIREYFGCGVPVVTTDVAGIGTRWLVGVAGEQGDARSLGEERIVVGERGILVPPDDPERFAAALLWLFCHPGARQQMGVAARRFAEAYCSWDEVARQTVAVFERIVRKA